MAEKLRSTECAQPPGATARDAREPIQVVVCARHGHVLRALHELVAAEWPRMLVIGAVSSLRDAERLLTSRTVDVVLTECSDVDEEELAQLIRLTRSYPRSAFVVLGNRGSVSGRLRDVRCTAILSFDAPAEQILDAVYAAFMGAARM